LIVLLSNLTEIHFRIGRQNAAKFAARFFGYVNIVTNSWEFDGCSCAARVRDHAEYQVLSVIASPLTEPGTEARAAVGDVFNAVKNTFCSIDPVGATNFGFVENSGAPAISAMELASLPGVCFCAEHVERWHLV
jgi:hypothetical protein